MPNLNRLLLLLLSLLLLCACESGWNYRWIVENRSGRQLRAVVATSRHYNTLDTIDLSSDTIPTNASRLLFEESRINSGPCPRSHPFVLRIYSGDTLIHSEDQGGSENWRSVYTRASVIFPSYDVNLWMLVSDTGVVWRKHCEPRESDF